VTHSTSEGISAAKIVTHSISKGLSAAENLTHSISEGVSAVENLSHSISEGGSAAKNLMHSISEGGSAAEILEMTEKEEEVMIITRGSGGKNVIFSNGPNSTSECLICSTRCQYDVLKVSLKKNDQNLPVGCIKH
jgi:hypothetical protein